MASDFDLGQMQFGSGSGMGAALTETPKPTSGRTKVASGRTKVASGRIKVGSLADLSGFVRVSVDTLVHTSSQDLWALRKEDDGFYVERLFQDDGNPIKG